MDRKSIMEPAERHQTRSRAVAPGIFRAKPRISPGAPATVSDLLYNCKSKFLDCYVHRPRNKTSGFKYD